MMPPRRATLLRATADRILALPQDRVLRIGIDGVDGAGKTTFADELARELKSSGRPIIRASIDGFHNPRATRYRLGKGSPEGFFKDSYDHAGMKSALLDPLGPDGSRRYRTAIFDHTTDSIVSSPEREASSNSILIFDGIFLHRPELRNCWDFSVFLDVAFTVSIPRGAQRGPGFGSPDPEADSNKRYVESQKLYLSSCEPKKHATLTIDNNDLAKPRILHRRNWMRFTLDRAQDPGDRLPATPIMLDHAPPLARLMDVAYTGTIDHEGESPEQCLAEMRDTIEGKYGSLIGAASFVSMKGGTATSASLITLWKEYPLLAFSMTAPEHQGKGMAGFLIQKSLFALKAAGHKTLYLVVTEGNTAAENLYRRLGFEFLGEAIPGRAVTDRALDTPRLTLEPITEAHAEELWELFNDPELHHFVPFEPGTLEKQRERCARWAKRKSPDGLEVWLNWAARDKATGKIAAHFQAGIKDADNRIASVGYVVARQFQRQGLATEGLKAVFDHLRNTHSVREVRASSDTRNMASHHLARKLGMTQVGFIKNADFFKGATSDEFVFSKVLGCG